MATHSTHPFSYSYLIQLLMQPTLKVLKVLIITYIVHKKLLTKLERLYTIIFDAVYASSTLSSLLFTLSITNPKSVIKHYKMD